MILYNDATSPFGRKVMVAAIERGIPLVETFVDLADAQHLDTHNPLRQIPVLVGDDGRGVYDSDVILHYFDSLNLAAPLLPGERQIEILTRNALANGLMEAAMLRILELRRPPEQQSARDVGVRTARVERAIAALEHEAPSFVDRPLEADHVTVGCALGYADFRFTTEWRASAPRLAAWYETIARRPSFATTAPTRSTPAAVPAR